MLKFYLILTNIFSICFLETINWNSFSIKILQENKYFTFGYLIYKINENEYRYFKYKNFDDITKNQFCVEMHFDGFKTFTTMIIKNETEKAYEFYPNKNFLE